jgi:transcriptional regulator with XRE-family HTH domain
MIARMVNPFDTITKATALRRARWERGLSMTELAYKAGVSIGTVRNAESGIMTARTAELLAAALNVQVGDIKP